MLQRFRIGPRLLGLIIIQAVTLVAIGVTAIAGLNIASSSTEQLNRNVSEGTRLGYMAEVVREDLLATVQDVRSGVLSWMDGQDRLGAAQRTLDQDWSAFITILTPDEREFVDDVLAPELEDVRQSFAVLGRIFEAQDAIALDRFLSEQADDLVQPFLNSVLASSAERELASTRIFESAIVSTERFLLASVAIVVVGVLIAGVVGVLIYRSIVAPIRVISGTVSGVYAGNYDVRAGLETRDELGELGSALDHLLEDKVTSLAMAEAENERLNDSVIRLLEGVDELSRRDLTVEVPVNPDVTGPVADAINKMSEEFGRVLAQVAKIASFVGTASTAVNQRAIAVNSVAEVQRKEVERTAQRLASASSALEKTPPPRATAAPRPSAPPRPPSRRCRRCRAPSPG